VKSADVVKLRETKPADLIESASIASVAEFESQT
jgi:hypothetical protein